MKLIDGKAIAAEIRAELKVRTQAFEETYGKKIGLAVVLIGNDPASQVYVRNKVRACEEAGIRSFRHDLPEETTQNQAEELVSALAEDENVHGILVQLPLPRGLDEKKLLSLIPPAKDVDGFLAENIGRLALKEEGTVACTPLGVMEMLSRSNIPVAGKRAVVIDVGMDRDENGKLCGDVDFENIKEKASAITPVPGGVGPMTIAMLLKNTCDAAERAQR